MPQIVPPWPARLWPELWTSLGVSEGGIYRCRAGNLQLLCEAQTVDWPNRFTLCPGATVPLETLVVLVLVTPASTLLILLGPFFGYILYQTIVCHKV